MFLHVSLNIYFKHRLFEHQTWKFNTFFFQFPTKNNWSSNLFFIPIDSYPFILLSNTYRLHAEWFANRMLHTNFVHSCSKTKKKKKIPKNFCWHRFLLTITSKRREEVLVCSTYKLAHIEIPRWQQTKKYERSPRRIKRAPPESLYHRVANSSHHKMLGFIVFALFANIQSAPVVGLNYDNIQYLHNLSLTYSNNSLEGLGAIDNCELRIVLTLKGHNSVHLRDIKQ